MIIRLFSIFLISVFVLSCGGKKESGSSKLSEAEESELLTKASSIFGALPKKMPGSENDTPELIELGKKLYFETKLSVNNTMSCNTCHDINNMAGVDGKPTSPGALPGKIGTRNTPTVFNAGFQFAQFWDGRAPDLKEQAKGPILNPVEMAMPNEKEVVKVISSIPEYQDLFKKAFPNEKNPITFDNIAHSIAAFERTLVSKSRYDQWVTGDKNALTDEEKIGLKTFIEVGCITCHTGPLFGGNLYQKMGLVKPYSNTKDLGRFDVTKQESDKFMFKVSMLRNVALTAPYFHDGAVKTLEEAVKIMADINLGKQLTDDQLKSIVAFLKALTDPKLEKKTALK
ncbi:cytochrome-c peroxidase [Bacteroidetes/Chlorobi group bacterium MS-B_bin-24]|jgi:cytochrome c peroxidase|nr:MAG: cytochrome-c peroxidase [Bacteroidetes/Chlorobi group bacterium MS-B_bin-24]